MPYSLLKLPYGLQQRLRGLAKPKEVYNLQIAAGMNDDIFLKPLQMYHNKYSKSFLSIEKCDEKLILASGFHEEPMDHAIEWEHEHLIHVEFPLNLLNLQPSDYDHPMFEYLLIDCQKIIFDDSVMNATILHKVAKLCNKDILATFKATSCLDRDLSVQLICDAFPNVTDVYLDSEDYARENWIQDILKLQPFNLTDLTIGGSLQNLLSFEICELEQLFSIPATFYLSLYCWNPPTNAADLIREKLKPYFNEVHDPLIDYNGFLNIHLGNGWEEGQDMFFHIV